MNKKIVTIVLTVLMFFSAVALGVSTVFRVDSVCVEGTTVTSEAKAQTLEIQEKLTAAYARGGIFSVKKQKAYEIMEEYPDFRITEIKKAYPNQLIFKIAEEAAVYAVESGGKVYVLSAEGVILDVLSAAEAQGSAMTRIKGLIISGKKGETPTGDDCFASMLLLCKGMNTSLSGIGRNILSVEVLRRTPQTVYRAVTREGVKIYVDAPTALAEEKGAAAIEKYLSLSDGERMTGRILVVDAEGSVSAGYAAKDEFIGL